MAKISGSILEPTRIIIINEADWTIEHNQVYEEDYEITGLVSGPKTIIAQATDNYQTLGKGHVTPIPD